VEVDASNLSLAGSGVWSYPSGGIRAHDVLATQASIRLTSVGDAVGNAHPQEQGAILAMLAHLDLSQAVQFGSAFAFCHSLI
jgi:hypothetical protein